MKTIFKGNKFSIVWEIFHNTTRLPFDFTGMNIEVSLTSNSYSSVLSNFNVKENVISTEIEANSLPSGVYDILCRFSTLNEQAYCFYKNAFHISNNPFFCDKSEKIEISTYATYVTPDALLTQFNSIYLTYLGNPKNTRNNIPEGMRRKGLIITYTNESNETITERATSDAQKDNDHWGLDTNWSRIDELSLSGDLSVSANGTWIINGKDTQIKAVGPKGDTGITPWLKTIDNRLYYSYDGKNWEACSEEIAAFFRFKSTREESNGATIGNIQISRDNKNWQDLSPEFVNHLRISAYVSTKGELPTNKPAGTMYGVGPTYKEEDTARANPIYRIYVYDGTTWVDNGSFTSIAAGIVQETGEGENVVMSQKAVTEVTTKNKIEGEKNLNEVKIRVNELSNIIGNYNDAFYVTDKNGYVLAVFDKDGIKSTSVKVLTKDGLKNVAIEGEGGSNNIENIIESYNDKFLITDNKGYVIASFDKDGLHVVDIEADGLMPNDWQSKKIATYGDSVTAICNGNFDKPFTNHLNSRWANWVADYFKMSSQYGRGIGAQGYSWKTTQPNGGSVCWLTPEGNFIARLDKYSYNSWDGVTYPSGVTAEMESQGNAIRVRGCLASWLRITKMFPSEIKDSIDAVLVMAHNDVYDTNECQFVENDTTDSEWADSGSEYYGKINGDYNINTFKGGVASTIMKLQLWMPNAIIILMTGISGQGDAGSLNMDINQESSINKANAIKEMSLLCSVPCIDVFANDGMNGWNRTKYITDTIHPYTTAGGKMIARAIIGGMKTIIPNI